MESYIILDGCKKIIKLEKGDIDDKDKIIIIKQSVS